MSQHPASLVLPTRNVSRCPESPGAKLSLVDCCLERGWREGRWRGLATRVMPLHPGAGGWIFRCRSEGPSEGAEVLQALILCTWRGSSRSVCPRVCWAYSRSGTMVPRAAWAGLPQISPTQFSPGTGFMPPWGMRVQLLQSLPNTWCSPYEHS